MRILIIAAALVTAFATSAGATAQDAEPYHPELVTPVVEEADDAFVAFRILDHAGAPVPAETVTILSIRLDMAPDGMAGMVAPLTPRPSDDPALIAYAAEITMAGQWALRVDAAIEGRAEPVSGTMILTVEPRADAGEAAEEETSGDRRVLYYRHPMGLPDISQTPRQDSMGMDYIPVYADEAQGADGSIRLSPERIQRTGVVTETARRMTLTRTLRTGGRVEADESRLSRVTMRFSGFIERLHVTRTGDRVARGAPLLEVWIEDSEVLRRQADLRTTAAESAGRRSAINNLRLYGLPDRDIERWGRAGPDRSASYDAPASGTVLTRAATPGMRFTPGMTLFEIADLSTVWVMLDVSEQDLALVRAGQPVRLTFPALPGETVTGEVAFMHPDLDAATRTGRARVVLPNPDGRLRLGMFARARLETAATADDIVAIPLSAVIDDGARQVALVAMEGGRFEPRDLVLGARGDDWIEIRSGVEAGEAVVVRGNFLIDSESRLQRALAAFAAPEAAQ